MGQIIRVSSERNVSRKNAKNAKLFAKISKGNNAKTIQNFAKTLLHFGFRRKPKASVRQFTYAQPNLACNEPANYKKEERIFNEMFVFLLHNFRFTHFCAKFSHFSRADEM